MMFALSDKEIELLKINREHLSRISAILHQSTPIQRRKFMSFSLLCYLF